MRPLPLLLAILLLLAACGQPAPDLPEGVAGSYVFGNAAKARKRATEPEPESPLAGLTTKDLLDRMEAGEEFTFTATVDMLVGVCPWPAMNSVRLRVNCSWVFSACST